MGKHEPMSVKAIANKIKAKGLQKIKYYCEACKKQCRDENGFKCHIMSEVHQRQMSIVGENPEKFINEFSDQFREGFMYLLRTRYRSKRILANTVFQDYIKDKEHVHMNATRWTSLTEFAEWLGEQGLATVDYSERGVMVTYIDNDPETLRRKELEAKREEQAREVALRTQKEIERQMEKAKQVYKEIEREKPEAAPVPIIKVLDVPSTDSLAADVELDGSKTSKISEGTTDLKVVERPVFQVQTISLKTATSSSYKPPPPKRKVFKSDEVRKKHRSK